MFYKRVGTHAEEYNVEEVFILFDYSYHFLYYVPSLGTKYDEY